jgi:hypothetical protein
MLADVTSAFAGTLSVMEARQRRAKSNGKGHDHSADDFRLAHELRRLGKADDEIAAALWSNPTGQMGSGKLSGDDGKRAVSRILSKLPPAPKPADPIAPFSWPDLQGQDPPPRRYIVNEWVPRGCVTSLYGPGGIGKSLLAQLLATCAATGRSWLGSQSEKCVVLALFCEDDDGELWRRQARINYALCLEMRDIGGFLPDARAGKDNTLAWPEHLRLAAAPLFEELRKAVAEYRPGLVILDNIAQMFAGNENDRAQVTAFVNMLAGIAREFDCAVVLLGHVAKGEGSTYSGSTAWDAAVRSRLFLERNEPQDEAPKLRLSRIKSNYAPPDTIDLIWRDGVIMADDPRLMTSAQVLEAKLRAGAVEQIFLNALETLRNQGRAVSDIPTARTYAPRAIKEAKLAGDATPAELTAAMASLFAAGRIIAGQPVTKGSNRHARTGIARRSWLTQPGSDAEQKRADDVPSDPSASALLCPLYSGTQQERSAGELGASLPDDAPEQERSSDAEQERSPKAADQPWEVAI